ncbi:MAG: aminoglycoside phosphotransferase family protein [Bacteroidota bacterium]
MNRTAIQDLSKEVLGQIPQAIIRKTIGICNEVYELQFADKSYILRMNREKEWIYGTHKFLPLFQELGIKVPSIIAEDYSKSSYPFCYQIQTKIAGQDLAIVFPELSPAELKAIAKEVSNIFDKFNALPYRKSFGGLTGMNEGQEESQLAIIKERVRTIRERNQSSNVLGEEVLQILDQLLTDYQPYFQSVRPKLYFDDLNSKNVMIHNGRFNGIVDLDFLTKGDYLEGIGGIIAAWYGTAAGEIYINAIFTYQRLDEFQQKVARAYGILHLILWTSEEGIRFNSNSTGEINWTRVEEKRSKILDLYARMG